MNFSCRTPTQETTTSFSTFFSTLNATSFRASSRSCRIFSVLKKLFKARATLSGLYILPAFRRVISSSAVRSIFTTSSASSSTLSGMRSFTSIPEIPCTSSLMLSICCMLTADITLIPSSSKSITSCQRFSFLLPSTLVCASSSTITISGWIRMIASRSISSSSLPL